MTKTKYYDLQMDDPQDDYDVDVVNANLKKIDEQMKTRENATDALQEPEFTVAAKRENIASKEKMPKILGKIAKFFADLKAVAFTGNYNDLSDKPTSLLANGGNSDTVNSHTVESNVPKNAKFTDTTYSNFVKSGTGAKAGLVPAPSTTAGTTKYLREDGAWKTPPDTKTSIVNNNTTTEPGSALDARQANPNIEGTMAASIAQINSNLNSVTRIYGELIAGENLKMRAGSIYNAIYIFGKLVMISFSVYSTADLNNGQVLAELPKSLQTKIEWNNLSGEILSSGYCPFVFSDNKQYIYIRTDNIVVHAGDEIRVWGIGFLR